MKAMNNFIAYEYKEVSVKRASINLYVDCFANFGWKLIEHYKSRAPGQSQSAVDTGVSHELDSDMIVLKLKRNSRLNNKREINRLENKCEAALADIRRLEDRKSAYTMGTALGAGIVGAGIMAIAIWNLVMGNTLAGFLIGVVGFGVCGVGFWLNHRMGQKMKQQLEPEIQQRYDDIHNICEEAYGMLV